MTRATLAAAVALVGCACGAQAPPTTTVPATVQPPLVYDVHEWGLVRAEAQGDAVRFGAVAPPVAAMPMVVLKPVLYFHADAAGTLASVTVTAGEGGTIAEAWPAVPTGASVTWRSVAIAPGGCAPSPLPSATDPFCTALGGDLCETAGLAVARTDDAACVTVGETTDRFLFYRGRSTSLTPPLSFERVGTAGEIRVTNGGGVIHGTLVRIRVTQGGVAASVIGAPGPNESITSAAPSPTGAVLDRPAMGWDPSTSGVAEARAALRTSMNELGLTTAEADAFLRAWDPSFFPTPDGGTTVALGLMPPADSFVYFLPTSATDDVATLAFDPPAREVRRAIAVWTAVAASGAGP